VTVKKVLEKEKLLEELEIMRGLIMMAYPAYHGLGDWEPIRVILENEEKFHEKIDLTDNLYAEESTIWIVGKELQVGKLLSDYFGKNEKQKFIVKVQKRGQGAPVREPMIGEEEHKKMLAFYYKKQEE